MFASFKFDNVKHIVYRYLNVDLMISSPILSEPIDFINTLDEASCVFLFCFVLFHLSLDLKHFLIDKLRVLMFNNKIS